MKNPKILKRLQKNLIMVSVYLTQFKEQLAF